MRRAILSLAILGTVGCDKDRDAQVSTTTTTSASVDGGTATVDFVRRVLVEKRPSRREDMERLVITQHEGVITLAGVVADERTRAEVVDTVRRIDGVADVRDHMKVRIEGVTATATPLAIRVRTKLARENPREAPVVSEIVIETDDAGRVILAGTVPDEEARRALVRSAEETEGVRSVIDRLRVAMP